MKQLAAILLLSLASSQAAELFFDFSKTNTLAAFHSTVTGEGKPGLWRVIEDEVPSLIPSITADAPVPKKSVLAQLSRDPTDEHYPILVYTNETFGDFTFTTRLKCVAGAVEQMAGVVFRYQDERNYYYIRASAKGSTFRFFKLVNGERSPPIGPEIQIPAGVWHDLTVECKGNKIRTLFNGKPIIPELTDNSFAAGRIGVWTKSDAVSHFADARITYTPREPFVKS
ncbi:MAG: family 16 glycoside hydrolase, partial [Limisphaerales bacterium]